MANYRFSIVERNSNSKIITCPDTIRGELPRQGDGVTFIYQNHKYKCEVLGREFDYSLSLVTLRVQEILVV